MELAAATPLARLKALSARYGLDQAQHSRLEALLSTLGDRRAPTATHAPGEAVDAHLADSLVALELEQVRVARTLADVGAGAGLPGLPLAIALRTADIHLVESQSRKCLFLEEAVARTGLDNARVVCVRAEEWDGGVDRHDVVVARAVAAATVVLEYAAPLLRVGGTLVDWRGIRDRPAEEGARRAAQVLGMTLLEVRRVEPFTGVRDHHLHVYEKTKPTPERFPRRPGIARKRPLGGASEGR